MMVIRFSFTSLLFCWLSTISVGVYGYEFYDEDITTSLYDLAESSVHIAHADKVKEPPDASSRRLESNSDVERQGNVVDILTDGSRMCGVVAVYQASRLLLKKNVDWESISQTCGPEGDAQVTSLAKVRRALEVQGFGVRAQFMENRGLDPEHLPAIAHMGELDEGHFIFVPAMGVDGSVLYSELDKVSSMSLAEFEEKWSGYILTIEPASFWKHGFWAYVLGGAGLIGVGQVLYLARRARVAMQGITAT